MKRIVILGSTGQIGQSALRIAERFPSDLQVIGLSCYQDSALFTSQVAQFKPQHTCIASQDPEGLSRLASLPDVDLVIVGVVGTAGIAPTLAAIESGTNVALATKEVLVIAGQYVLSRARAKNVAIIPIDSEHSALFQSLQSGRVGEIDKIYLTMGTGPIAQMSLQEMTNLQPAAVLKPNHWHMGPKITLDSATCVNKVHEAIEAAYLFDLQPHQINIVVHPEYLCHSLVQFIDGSIIGEFGVSDIDRYLQYALFYPERKPAPTHLKLDLYNQHLSFLPPPVAKFPALSAIPQLLAHPQMNLPAVWHGLDRVLVDAFVAQKITFPQISHLLLQGLDTFSAAYQGEDNISLENALRAEEKGAQLATNLLSDV